MQPVYKVFRLVEWREFEVLGRFDGSPDDRRDGFIHFSTATQVVETAAKHFAGQQDLLLVRVNADQLGERLKWEPSRGGALFPHLYGDLHLSAVTQVDALPLDSDNRHLFPPLAE